jgi:hypothetical protein
MICPDGQASAMLASSLTVPQMAAVSAAYNRACGKSGESTGPPHDDWVRAATDTTKSAQNNLVT